MSPTPFHPLPPAEAALFTAHPRPVLVLDAEHRVRYVNPAGLVLAPPDDDPVGHVVWERYPSLAGSGLHREYARVIESRRPAVFEEYVPSADVWYAVTAYPADDGLVAILRDITSEKRTERALERAERELEQAQEIARLQEETRRLRDEARREQQLRLESLGLLAGGIAHDFNNLLVGVMGNASLLSGDLPMGSPHRGPVEEIEQAAARASELTRLLLAYAGKGQFVLEPVDLSRIARTCADRTASRVPPHISVVQALRGDMPPIVADGAQIERAVAGVLANAREAVTDPSRGDRPGTIVVRTATTVLDAAALDACDPEHGAMPGRFVRLDVVDDGIGMDDDVRSRMFEPFFSTRQPGRGLGISATLGIVRSHRGAICVTTAPGRGTTVSLLFPVDATNRNTPRSAAAA